MAAQKKTPKTNKVLPEVEKYYEAEKRERAGLAWLLAVASVAIVAAVLIGAFFGGRWLYRKYTGKTDNTTVSVETTSQASESQSTTQTTEPVDAQSQSTDGNTAQTTTSPSASNASSTSSQAQETTNASTNVSQASASTSQLVNTGAESVLPVFIVTSVFGTLLYRRKLSR